jgi:hypothetical protein
MPQRVNMIIESHWQPEAALARNGTGTQAFSVARNGTGISVARNGTGISLAGQAEADSDVQISESVQRTSPMLLASER